MPKLLFLGDIVGRPGREFVRERLPALRAELEADFVIANGENAAGGAGITALRGLPVRNDQTRTTN